MPLTKDPGGQTPAAQQDTKQHMKIELQRYKLGASPWFLNISIKLKWGAPSHFTTKARLSKCQLSHHSLMGRDKRGYSSAFFSDPRVWLAPSVRSPFERPRRLRTKQQLTNHPGTGPNLPWLRRPQVTSHHCGRRRQGRRAGTEKGAEASKLTNWAYSYVFTRDMLYSLSLGIIKLKWGAASHFTTKARLSKCQLSHHSLMGRDKRGYSSAFFSDPRVWLAPSVRSPFERPRRLRTKQQLTNHPGTSSHSSTCLPL